MYRNRGKSGLSLARFCHFWRFKLLVFNKSFPASGLKIVSLVPYSDPFFRDFGRLHLTNEIGQDARMKEIRTMRRHAKPRFGTSLAFATLLLLSASTKTFAGTITGSGNLGGGNLQVTEIGTEGFNYLVFPTWHDDKGDHRFVEGKYFVYQSANLDIRDPDGLFHHTFTLAAEYYDEDSGDNHKVSNYEQTTADPGTLYAAVFKNGVMLDSILEWFDANVPGGNSIIQPDFNLVGGGDVYYGVNLADLLNAGGSFASTYSFGDVFAIDANGQLPALPMYEFSSTPLTYTPGSGWTGDTPLNPGTQLSYIAKHVTTELPEPASLSLFAVGSLLIAGARLVSHARLAPHRRVPCAARRGLRPSGV
jgi:hypothetical protein